MKASAALAFLLIMPLAALRAADAPTPKRNVAFLLADDLRPDCLSKFGHAIVKTPNGKFGNNPNSLRNWNLPKQSRS